MITFYVEMRQRISPFVIKTGHFSSDIKAMEAIKNETGIQLAVSPPWEEIRLKHSRWEITITIAEVPNIDKWEEKK